MTRSFIQIFYVNSIFFCPGFWEVPTKITYLHEMGKTLKQLLTSIFYQLYGYISTVIRSGSEAGLLYEFFLTCLKIYVWQKYSHYFSLMCQQYAILGYQHILLVDVFWAWVYQHTLGSKNQARKIDKIHKHIKFLCIISCGKLFEYSQYVLFTKRIETFQFRSFSNTRNIRTYRFKHVKVFILVEMYQYQKRKKV